MTSTPLDAAYQYCQQAARQHYENFPVASLLLPRRLRKHVAAIYCFARKADDLADEGKETPEHRLQALAQMREELIRCADGNPSNQPVYLALADTLQRFKVPVSLFCDLIDAFSQDVRQNRYIDFNEVLDYCRRSANPVGRLMLHLHDQTDTTSCLQSDAICTALQLINFYQDLYQDYHEMGRIYIPQQDMQLYGVTENHFSNAMNDDAMHRLMQLQYQRAAELLRQGKTLGRRLRGRFGIEIRLIIAGGERILHKLEQQQNPFGRPRLELRDKLWMLKTALLS